MGCIFSREPKTQSLSGRIEPYISSLIPSRRMATYHSSRSLKVITPNTLQEYRSSLEYRSSTEERRNFRMTTDGSYHGRG